MPLFDFKCTKCGRVYEGVVLQGEKIDNCPKCGCPKATQLFNTKIRVQKRQQGPANLQEAVVALQVALASKIK